MNSSSKARPLADPATLRPALIESFAKLDPRHQVRNPVIFVVEIGALITTVGWLIQVFGGAPLGGGGEPAWFAFTVSAWLWLTVVFANLARRSPRAAARHRRRPCGRCARRPSPASTAAARSPPRSSPRATWSWSRRAS